MMEFDEWFDANGYDEQYRIMFRKVWEDAQDAMGEESSIYLSPEQRAAAQRELNKMYRNMVDNLALGKKP